MSTTHHTDQVLPGFAYSQDFFAELVDTAIAHAKKLGATGVGAESREGAGLFFLFF